MELTPELLNTLNFALTVVNFCVATVLVVRGVNVNRQVGAAETTSSDQYAYEELLDSRASVASQEAGERFYDRFWAEQILQYEHWRSRLIPDLIYADWIVKRREQFRKNAVVGGISFRAAWAQRQERYSHTSFGRFIKRAIADGASDQETAKQALRRAKAAMARARSVLA